MAQQRKRLRSGVQKRRERRQCARTGWVGAEEQVALPEGQQRGEADHLARRLPLAQRVDFHCLPQ